MGGDFKNHLYAPGLTPGWFHSFVAYGASLPLLASRTLPPSLLKWHCTVFNAGCNQGVLPARVHHLLSTHTNALSDSQPPWKQPRGKWMVSLVTFHTNATSKRWHLRVIDLRLALNSTPRWIHASMTLHVKTFTPPMYVRKVGSV